MKHLTVVLSDVTNRSAGAQLRCIDLLSQFERTKKPLEVNPARSTPYCGIDPSIICAGHFIHGMTYRIGSRLYQH